MQTTSSGLQRCCSLFEASNSCLHLIKRPVYFSWKRLSKNWPSNNVVEIIHKLSTQKGKSKALRGPEETVLCTRYQTSWCAEHTVTKRDILVTLLNFFSESPELPLPSPGAEGGCSGIEKATQQIWCVHMITLCVVLPVVLSLRVVRLVCVVQKASTVLYIVRIKTEYQRVLDSIRQLLC